MAVNASKAGLVDETRLALLLYQRLGDLDATKRKLLQDVLPQRSRSSREGIVERIVSRLARWNPPAWVCQDLIAAATVEDGIDLRALLLVHAARQDRLLYEVIQCLVVPRWRRGEQQIIRADVQHFLDAAESDHPEIARWSRQTREKLASNVLAILHDYGLLTGKVTRRIVEPVVRSNVAGHLERLLLEEGIVPEAVPTHPDWRLWLWDEQRVKSWQIRRDRK
ncbi:MAG: DUF1819 family protein [Chloroflexi bacterium]|nr:DUF1819 family protein [Chloroflexota bacterium]